MSERYRYLPCALHEALEIPAWFDYERVVSADDKTGPFCCHYIGPKGEDEDLDEDDIDMCRVIALDHPAGWDHAVRALAAIRGVEVPESCSVAFVLREPNGYGVPVAEVYVMDAMGTSGRLVQTFAEPPHCPHRDLSVVLRRGCTPTARREALCRCICAALGVDVGAVFPVERV